VLKELNIYQAMQQLWTQIDFAPQSSYDYLDTSPEPETGFYIDGVPPLNDHTLVAPL
jgi:hypothetical protein